MSKKLTKADAKLAKQIDAMGIASAAHVMATAMKDDMASQKKMDAWKKKVMK